MGGGPSEARIRGLELITVAKPTGSSIGANGSKEGGCETSRFGVAALGDFFPNGCGQSSVSAEFQETETVASEQHTALAVAIMENGAEWEGRAPPLMGMGPEFTRCTCVLETRPPWPSRVTPSTPELTYTH